MRDALIAKGNAYLRAGKLREALYLYQQVVVSCPELAAIAQFNLRWAEVYQLKPFGKSLMDLSAPYAFVPAGSYADKLATLANALAAKKVSRQDLETNFFTLHSTAETAGKAPQPLISVIMPTYNRAGMLLDSVHTVLQQSYTNWELLLCDDCSTDHTQQLIEQLYEPRVRYLRQEKQGAAAARNLGLRHANGEFITYLDTDNYWHPHYLQLISTIFAEQPSQLALYFDYIDFKVSTDGAVSVLSMQRPRFSHERLIEKPFIDLNTFAHRRELVELFGGFDTALSRRQDYDVILKYSWLKDPLHVPLPVALYQRNENFSQITREHGHDFSPVERINAKIAAYFQQGLPLVAKPQPLKITVLVWDHCRNHFSKAYAVAEALSAQYDVQLMAFDFFNEGIFAPLKHETPSFEVTYFKGADFPEFFTTMQQALDAIRGDLLYVVKPRVPSMGLAMLANQHRGIPFVLESNDLETVVNLPAQQLPKPRLLSEMVLDDAALTSPYSDTWSALLDPLAQQLPYLVSHNKNLDQHYRHNSMMMRNIKDEAVYNPARYDRDALRQSFGFAKEDRIILFGGLIRKHKGVFELIELLDRLQDPRYKVVFVASRATPDQQALLAEHADRLKMLPAQDREGMAKINYAADLVVLWLNPAIAASHYQFPYKATDAFAMETPVIANDIADLGDLAKQGYLTEVPFGDWGAMQQAIEKLFNDNDYRKHQVSAARRLFLRQFSYTAARSNFALIRQFMQKHPNSPYPASATFADFFEAFYHAKTGQTGFVR